MCAFVKINSYEKKGSRETSTNNVDTTRHLEYEMKYQQSHLWIAKGVYTAVDIKPRLSRISNF